MHNTSGTFGVILEATFYGFRNIYRVNYERSYARYGIGEYFENPKCKYQQKFCSFDTKGQKHFRPKQILFTCCKAVYIQPKSTGILFC